MQDSHDQNAIRLGQIEDDVTTNLESPQTGLNRIAGSADGRAAGQQIESILQLAKIAVSLTPSPGLDCVGNDPVDVALGFGRDSIRQG